jgi:plasmid stability protein
MAQLLVRDIPETLVKKLKRRAEAHGVSAEEEHRRILREALSAKPKKEQTLMDFILSCEVVSGEELPLERSKVIETRDIGF